MAIPPVQPGLSYAPAGTRPEPAAIVGQGGGQGVAAALTAAAAAQVQAATLDPLMAALSQALGAAAAQQDGLAPLFANLDALAQRADVPANLKAAAQSLVNLRVSDQSLDGNTVRQAVSRSGLFVEAVQARGLTPDANIKSALQSLRIALQAVLATAPADAAAAPLSAAPAPGQTAAVDAGVRPIAVLMLAEAEAALARPSAPGAAQTPVSPALAAQIDALLAQPDVPDDVRHAAQALLVLRQAGTASDVIGARHIANSPAALLEALQAGRAGADEGAKSALRDLQSALQNYLGEKAPAEARTPPLPPPFRGALPVAQPPVPASIADTGLRQAALTVLSETDAAIARHVMLQIASLPASQQPSHPPDDHTQRLVLDIPLMTPQGTTIVQMQIEREAPQRESQAPVWTIRFAVDIDPIGAVRARVAVIGGKASVTLVAENPGGAVALQQDIGSLKAALAQANLEPGDLHCMTHDQTRVTAPQGQFVNRAL